MKLLDDYFAKGKHTNKERKKFSTFMENEYKKYLNAYHNVKIKYRTLAEKKMSFKEFKDVYKSEYLISHDVKETRKAMTLRENLLTLETRDVDYYFKTKQKNFESNLENIKKRLKKGESLNKLENLMLKVDKERRYQKRDFMWSYNRIIKLGNEMGIIWTRAYDSPETIEE